VESVVIRNLLELNFKNAIKKLKEKIIMAKGSALKKEMKASEDLQEIVKHRKISRGQMMKSVWKYIKKHKLQDKKDKRTINPDKKLGAVIGSKPLSMFKMTAKLSKHLS
jgi:chromatin remodeling complex protein RSC6